MKGLKEVGVDLAKFCLSHVTTPNISDSSYLKLIKAEEHFQNLHKSRLDNAISGYLRQVTNLEPGRKKNEEDLRKLRKLRADFLQGIEQLM